MIISKTPFRISLFGGGTDYPIWYNNNSGRVISSTIDKYAIISLRTLPPFFQHKYRIIYSIIECVNKFNEIKHPAVREILKSFNLKEGLEIHYDGDLPARSGLGSSSSFTVGLLNILNHLNDIKVSKKKLAEQAIDFEQNIMKENVGSQDQIAAAYGGLNEIVFKKNRFTVNSLNLDKENLNKLQKSICLCFSGKSRFASNIAKKKTSNIKSKTKIFEELESYANEGIKIIKAKSIDLKLLGNLLNESWNSKKKLSKIVTNDEIDYIYNKGIQAGAYGGKILGAGGGGFIIFIADSDRMDYIKKKLKPFTTLNINFSFEGSKIYKIF